MMNGRFVSQSVSGSGPGGGSEVILRLMIDLLVNYLAYAEQLPGVTGCLM